MQEMVERTVKINTSLRNGGRMSEIYLRKGENSVKQNRKNPYQIVALMQSARKLQVMKTPQESKLDEGFYTHLFMYLST